MKSSSSQNYITRGLRQMDRAFWCLHDHLPSFVVLGLPTFFASLTFASILVAFIRMWSPDPLILFILWSVVVPIVAMTIITFLPLPCAVFAWSEANGESRSTQECFSWCLRRTGRLAGLLIWFVFNYTWWFLLAGIPMLTLWARTCQAPMVALFEDRPGIMLRSRQLTKEDGAIHILAILVLLLALVLGLLIPMPRLFLFSKIFESEWTRLIEESLWAFELICGILLLSALAISWCVALTLFYHDVRYVREGEAINKKIAGLFEKYVHGNTVS